MNRVILGLILMAIYTAPSMSQELHFTFTCDGKNSTMSSYAYVKEPSLSESGYTRGLKTGSFNYLDGGMIDLSEEITYEYGNGTYVGNNSSDRSVTHTLEVDFDGRRGISEFYGKGFFNYNRVVSAWKKIRYEDLERYENVTLKYSQNGIPYSRNGFNTSTLGTTRTARNFSVDASVEMYTNFETESYDFNYKASAKDAVIETKDAAGWSNRTGARRIDFEHDSLMSGEELNITNVLQDSHPWTVEAGGDGWLSCCIGGTSKPYNPEIEQWSGCEDGSCEPEGKWPDGGTWATLEPAKLLPNVNRTQQHMIGPDGELRSADPTYNDFNCSDENCSGYECIYQFAPTVGAGTGTTAAGVRSEFANITGIEVDQNVDIRSEGSVTIMMYNITVTNAGEVMLKNVTLYDTLPLNASYNGSKYKFEAGEPELLNETHTKKDKSTLPRVNLSLASINSGDTRVVVLTASHDGVRKEDKYYQTNKVYVTGDAPGGLKVNDTATAPHVPPPENMWG